MSIPEEAAVERVSARSTLVERLRRPEYTGANRCLPCTVLNVVIAIALSGGLLGGLLVMGAGALLASLASTVSLLAFLGAIYLRGYLVPYTPTLTKRYFPDRILRLFEEADHHGATPPDAVDVEGYLLDRRLLVECDNVDDWCLDRRFERRWRSKMDEMSHDGAREDAITTLLDVDTHRLSLREFGTATLVRVDNRQVGQWESNAAFLADIAADAVLREEEPTWGELPLLARSRILNTLRMFLETCPGCGGPLRLGRETVESCCRSFDVVAVTCEACESRIFELDADRAGI